MLKSDFNYTLPAELIAQFPLADRTASRLLHLDEEGILHDRVFQDLPGLLRPGDLLVLNDTRVIPARLSGHKETGGKIEILIERVLTEYQALAHIRASKAPHAGSRLRVDEHVFRVLGRSADLYWLELEGLLPVMDVLTRAGHVPLPPYIHHTDGEDDRDRYQTVFAEKPGAIAAPTAGLHFDRPLLDRLEHQGVASVYLTLHVGSGTFQPIRENDLSRHQMHPEHCELDAEVVERIAATRQAGGRIIAVGTTVVRTLETAALTGVLKPYRGDTRLFIQPGFRFRCVDAMLTNFHLPESTLLSLVCAFAGYEPVMQAYHHAVARRYRFFSYGDSMFLTPKPQRYVE